MFPNLIIAAIAGFGEASNLLRLHGQNVFEKF